MIEVEGAAIEALTGAIQVVSALQFQAVNYRGQIISGAIRMAR
jgi:hypothetical protein